VRCEHEQVDGITVTAPVDAGAQVATARVMLFSCGACGSIFRVTEDGIELRT
jgi:hypothetical protein